MSTASGTRPVKANGTTTPADQAGVAPSDLTATNHQASWTPPSPATGLSHNQAVRTSSGLLTNRQAVRTSTSRLPGLTENGQAVRTAASRPVESFARPAAATCSGCMVDETGACLSNPNDPFGTTCDSSCVLADNGDCSVPGAATAPCLGCTVDDQGTCVGDGTGDCAATCISDSTGAGCFDSTDGSVGGSTTNGNELYAWLVPPTKTTAMGFW